MVNGGCLSVTAELWVAVDCCAFGFSLTVDIDGLSRLFRIAFSNSRRLRLILAVPVLFPAEFTG